MNPGTAVSEQIYTDSEPWYLNRILLYSLVICITAVLSVIISLVIIIEYFQLNIHVNGDLLSEYLLQHLKRKTRISVNKGVV